jgi:glycosyltransferase involved in cell wall biosynthesis
MKIVLLQDWLRGGGTERQTVRLAQAFAVAGHDTVVVTFRPGGVLAAELPAAAPVRHLALQRRDLGLDWFAPRLRATLRALAPRVVVAMGRMANCHAGRLPRALPGATVIATLRTGKPLPWLHRRALGSAHHIVANSVYSLEHYVPPARRHAATVIYNALAVPAPAAAPTDRTHPAPAGPARLLCVAQFRPEKDHAELLHLLAGLPAGLPWALDLVGDGPTRPRCERLAAALGLAGRVTFHGWHREPAPFYCRAAAAVLTSRRESLPNFLIEAQCAGLPVVAYAAGGVAECFAHGHSGTLVAAGDRAAFQTAVARLLTEFDHRSRQAAAAAQWARERFDPTRRAAEWLALFNRLGSAP